MKATSEELAKYAERSRQYLQMADHLQELWVDPTILTTDPQVRALAGTFAAECRELAKRWAEEKEGGL